MSVVRVCERCKREMKPPIWGNTCRKCITDLVVERTRLLKNIHWMIERAEVPVLRTLEAKLREHGLTPNDTSGVV